MKGVIAIHTRRGTLVSFDALEYTRAAVEGGA